MFDDTIAALATPLAQSAISIIRLSGPSAIELADQIFTGSLQDKDSHTIHYGYIKDPKSISSEGKPALIDEVLISLFRAPKTYTREDVVEINCHGGPFITRKILALVLEQGARMARPGEFTQRAFLNGRIDLSQAEAVEDMIEAGNEQAAKMAIGNIRGSIRKLLEPLIDDLMNIIAQIEVNIDYPEYEDIEQLRTEELLPKTRAFLDRLETILRNSASGQILKNGIDTVIVGKPNVGKSSLLNALLDEDKAIVTDIAGTTRDIVEGQIHVGDLQLNLIDTSGIRKAKDKIERIGIKKSRQKLEQAQLVLLVFDTSRSLDDLDDELMEQTKDKNRILLLNKTDLLGENEEFAALLAEDKTRNPNQDPILFISAKEGDIHSLIDFLSNTYMPDFNPDAGLLANARQMDLLKKARMDIIKSIKAMEAGIEPDLIEIDLMAAHDHLKEILGEVHRDDLLDTLFSRFCLGK